ncbi:hypothetical protein CUB90_01025 [Clostridium sp. CT7]|nr:hypothetical protein CUB90_01025 [Clostridium sp. CT7]
MKFVRFMRIILIWRYQSIHDELDVNHNIEVDNKHVLLIHRKQVIQPTKQVESKELYHMG